MNPFIKTLVGDGRNLAAVAGALGITAVGVWLGQPRLASLALPVLVLAAVGFLAKN